MTHIYVFDYFIWLYNFSILSVSDEVIPETRRALVRTKFDIYVFISISNSSVPTIKLLYGV